MVGSCYIRQIFDTFDADLTQTIAAYNCGPEWVKCF